MKESKKEITIYVAEDGMEFKSKEDCVRHEKSLHEFRDRLKVATITEIAYELYKIDWLKDHASYDIESATFREYGKYQFELIEDGDFDNGYEGITYEEWLESIGYETGMYVSFEEFVDNEFLDEEYIKELLSNDILVAAYENLIAISKLKLETLNINLSAMELNHVELFIDSCKKYLRPGTRKELKFYNWLLIVSKNYINESSYNITIKKDNKMYREKETIDEHLLETVVKDFVNEAVKERKENLEK